MKRKMKINGLFIFSLVLGTFSLSLNQNADLIEDATTTLPSVDIAKSSTDAYTDLDSTVVPGFETAVQSPDVRKGNKDDLSYPKKDSNFLGEHIDRNIITTDRPSSQSNFTKSVGHDSEIKSDPEVKSDSKSQDWSIASYVQKIKSKFYDSKANKLKKIQSEPPAEKSLKDNGAVKESTDTPPHKNSQEKYTEDTQIESSGQGEIISA